MDPEYLAGEHRVGQIYLRYHESEPSPTGCSGTTVEIGNQDHNSTTWKGYILAMPCNLVVDDCYDKVYVDCIAATGNIRICVYDDVSGPQNLIVESDSLTMQTGFTSYSIPQFTATSVKHWIGLQFDDNATDLYYDLAAGLQRFRAWTFGAFQDPLTGESGYSSLIHCKIEG